MSTSNDHGNRVRQLDENEDIPSRGGTKTRSLALVTGTTLPKPPSWKSPYRARSKGHPMGKLYCEIMLECKRDGRDRQGREANHDELRLNWINQLSTNAAATEDYIIRQGAHATTRDL